MVLLACTTHKGLIGYLLSKDVLEGVYGGSVDVSLVEKLSGLEVPEILVHGLLRHFYHGLQQGQSDVLADHCCRLEQAFGSGR
jgi:hypothetical protein